MTEEKSFLSVGATLKKRYVIEAEVGRGGYSVVYKANDTTPLSLVRFDGENRGE